MSHVNAKKLGKQIRRLRMERHLSQDDLAKALGMHRQSISLLEQGERDLSAIELDELARFLQISYDDILAPEMKSNPEKTAPTHVRFASEKLREMLLYLLELVGGRANVGETVLYKLLYFSDFNHYEKTGEPITGLTYRRLQFGPVPQRDQFQAIVDDMIRKKELQKIEHDFFGKPQIRYISLRNANENMLSPTERQTIQAVANKLGWMNARQIEEYVHNDIPWEATGHQKPIEYELVRWRSSPYSILTEDEKDRLSFAAQDVDIAQELEPMSQDDLEYYESLPDLSHATK